MLSIATACLAQIASLFESRGRDRGLESSWIAVQLGSSIAEKIVAKPWLIDAGEDNFELSSLFTKAL